MRDQVLAHSKTSSLALLRAVVWDEATEVMHMLRLPRPALVASGTEAAFTLPIILTLGGSAVDITTPATCAPASRAASCVASFDVARLRRGLLHPGALQSVPASRIEGGLCIPGSGDALSWEAIEASLNARARPRGSG
ncbi:MAG: hypothetical protein IPI67_00525 [Myxococcales bacterium]|nr:hypothetical protein [Myxococcales bacterium]